jgi:hypothetical protein
MTVKKSKIPSHFCLHARTQQRTLEIFIFFNCKNLATRKPKKHILLAILKKKKSQLTKYSQKRLMRTNVKV